MHDTTRTVRLGRSLKPRHVSMIALGGIIGAGLFIGAGGAIHRGGPGVALAYAVCGGLIFLIMRMLGEMAVAEPGRGSFAEYAAIGLGAWAGSVSRWLYWYFWVFTVGAETVAGAKLLQQAGVPGPVWAVGLGLIALMTLANLLSVRAFGELEFWFALLKVAAIGAFVALGLGFILGFGPGPGHALATLAGHGGWLPNGVDGLVAAVPIVIFSMMGSEVATIAAAESEDPAGNVARAARTVALRILIFYVASIVVITAIVPWDALRPGISPFRQALDAIGIPGSAAVMSAIVLTAVLSCLNSGLYITSRMLWELARAGDAPRFLAATARNETPAAGILISFAAGAAAALAQFFLSRDVFTLLASTAGDIILFIYLIVALAQIRARRRLEAAGVAPRLRVWLFPWLSWAVVAGLGLVPTLLALLPEERLTLLLSSVTILTVLGAVGLRRLRETRAGLV